MKLRMVGLLLIFILPVIRTDFGGAIPTATNILIMKCYLENMAPQYIIQPSIPLPVLCGSKKTFFILILVQIAILVHNMILKLIMRLGMTRITPVRELTRR
ncbi:MAG: hypothetical protein CVV39_08890 [Planctomycetes bacterium HGW-Planctomycetes-1]|nr:MAG: hypothetical protein CVV39_08890 [Planctomycetes bacterium HGW-Planctomycetes-1]